MSNFNEISSIDSKFDALDKFYKDLERLETVKSKNKNTKKKKVIVLKMHQCFMMSWLVPVKKKKSNNNQSFKSKDKYCRLKHDYKNLKGLDYLPDQSQLDQSQSDELVPPKWVRVTKNRFAELLNIVT